jgi:predicted metal-binding membrane protein
MSRPNVIRGRTIAAPTALAVLTALIVTAGITVASWVLAVQRMNGMAMGVATGLGSFESFVVLWALMMAAMMVPGAVPAVVRHTLTRGQLRAVPLFVGSYLAVWTLLGLAVYALYRPHGYLAAAVVTTCAGVYELTPLKRHFRQRCYDSRGPGFDFGLYCVGSSIGLMLMLVAISVMSIGWMAVIAVLVVAQKLLPGKAAIDAGVGLVIIGLGVLMIAAPSAVPGLMPPM